MNDLQQNLQTLQLLGFQLPTPAFLAISTLFGFIGLYAWLRGRRAGWPSFKWIGLVLMFYPLCVSDTMWMSVIGLALCAALYACRGR